MSALFDQSERPEHHREAARRVEGDVGARVQGHIKSRMREGKRAQPWTHDAWPVTLTPSVFVHTVFIEPGQLFSGHKTYRD